MSTAPQTDRIACPWLIRRFIDPDAEILDVPKQDVLGVAGDQQAHPAAVGRRLRAKDAASRRSARVTVAVGIGEERSVGGAAGGVSLV